MSYNPLVASGLSQTLIAETVVSSAQSSVTFSNLGGYASLYRDLTIKVRGRSDKAAQNANLLLQVNGDTGANYDSSVATLTTSMADVNNVGVTSAQLGYLPGTTAPTNEGVNVEISIPFFSNTTFEKAFTGYSGIKNANTSGSVYIIPASGFWRSTAAITSVTLFLDSGNFVSGSVISIYGEGPTTKAGASSGGGSLVFLGSQDASSSASLDFTNVISGLYDEYEIHFVDLLPVTGSGNNLLMQLSTDGGATYSSANYLWSLLFSYSGGASPSVQQSSSDSAFHVALTNPNVSAGAPGECGTVRLVNPLSSTAYKIVSVENIHFDTGGAVYSAKGGGAWESTTAANAFRFKFSSGNIASGSVRVYGVAKSGGNGTGVTKISEQVLTATASTVTFSNIPQNFRTLKLRVTCASDQASVQPVYVQVNGDTGANYDGQQVYGGSSSAGVYVGNGVAQAALVHAVSTGAPAGQASTLELAFHNYAGTIFLKNATGNNWRRDNSTTGYTANVSWEWHNTAAITSLLVGVAAGNFVVGSVFSLYGEM